MLPSPCTHIGMMIAVPGCLSVDIVVRALVHQSLHTSAAAQVAGYVGKLRGCLDEAIGDAAPGCSRASSSNDKAELWIKTGAARLMRA